MEVPVGLPCEVLLQGSLSQLPWRENLVFKTGATVMPPQALLTDGKQFLSQFLIGTQGGGKQPSNHRLYSREE